MQESRTINWKKLGIAALLLLPVSFMPAVGMKTAKADVAVVTAAPVFISGTVRQYFTNRAGYVSALVLETSSGREMVHFAPSWAQRLLANSPVGSKLEGWIIPHHEDDWSWNDLVSIGKDSPTRILTDPFPSGEEELSDQPWIWGNGKNGDVSGRLERVIVNGNGDVLALVLDNGALVRVPPTVRNEELGAYGTDAIAPLFKNVEVSAWGAREWQARGDVSIYNQHLAATGLSINGKIVSAIGIPRFPVHTPTLFDGNINLIDATSVEVVGADGEYAPFGPHMVLVPEHDSFHHDSFHSDHSGPSSPTIVLNQHVGHAMLMTADGKFYPAVHQGLEVYAVIHNDAFQLPLVNGAYLSPSGMEDSKLVMIMDDGRQFEMSSSDSQLFVDLPDGSTAPVRL